MAAVFMAIVKTFSTGFSNGMDYQTKNDHFLGVAILTAAVIIGGAFVYKTKINSPSDKAASVLSDKTLSLLEKAVLPTGGVALPVDWKSFGKQMVEAGVIDKKKFEDLYAQRGGLDQNQNLLDGTDNGRLKITKENSSVILNLLWAFGLSNKNEILAKGPMSDPKYGGAGKFASTGGWTLAAGNAMNHYGKHAFVTLTPDQQTLVESVSRNIYRPCCGNPTYFPDCNHGMAMLGLLELMAAQGVSEPDMYKTALAVNSFWFPNNYLTIAKYLKMKNIDWAKADSKEILGANFSSSSGYKQILNQIQPATGGSGWGCGV